MEGVNTIGREPNDFLYASSNVAGNGGGGSIVDTLYVWKQPPNGGLVEVGNGLIIILAPKTA